MIELIRKEVRAIAPMIWLAVFLALFPWLGIWTNGFPDQGGPSHWWTQPQVNHSDSVDFFQFLFIAIVSAAHGILLKEKDDGTLEFLDSLPAGRSRLFLAKAIALQAPVLAFGLADLVATAFELWLSRTSLDPRWHAQWLGRGVGLVMVGGWAFAGLGMALGFLRRFAVMALMLWYALYLGLSQAGISWADHLNLFGFARDDYYGLDWLAPWPEIRRLLVTGLCAYGIAWLGWLGTGGSARLSSGATQARAVVAVIGAVTAVVSAIAAMVLWMFAHWNEIETAAQTEISDSTEVADAAFPEAPPFRMRTEHFDIIAPSSQRTQAESLASQADTVLRQVSDFLQIPPPPGRIVADFTAQSPHALGLAGWKRINLMLARIPDKGTDSQAVLGHELTHVFIDLGSDQKASDRFTSTRWFHEGLASYLEYRFWRSPDELRTFRRAAAVAHHRRQSNFDTLADNHRFTHLYDPNLVYSLGEAWCHALVRHHGDSAPGTLVKTLATATPASPAASPLELWQTVMAAADFDYASVLEEYRRVLDTWATEESDFIASLPPLRPRLITRNSRFFGVEVASDSPLPSGARTIVLFRKQGATMGLDYQYADHRDDGIHWVQRDNFPHRELEVIVGLQTEPTAPAHFHEWVKLRTR